MNEKSQRERLRWKKKPFPELVRLAWPIAVSMLSFSIMTVVDTLFVGRLGAPALAAVGLGGMTAFILFCFGFGLLRAPKILVAQAVGAGRTDLVARYLGASLVLAAGLGLVAALVGQALSIHVPSLAVGDVSGRWAAEYVAVRTGAGPVVMCACALREARHAVGDSRTPMRAAILGNLANLPVNALFIFGFGWGVAGAAWATVVAQAVEAFLLVSTQKEAGFGLRDLRACDVSAVWRLGVPLGLERLLDAGAFAAMVTIFARMGDVDLAAHQVGVQLLHFSFLPGMAIGDAASVLVGQAVGARQLRLVPRVQAAALGLSMAYAAGCSVVFLSAGSSLAALFTSERIVVARAAEILSIAAIFLMAIPAYQIGQASLRGTGDVRAAAWITVVLAWACTPALALWLGLALELGVAGGWLGLGFEVTLGALAFFARWKSGAWLKGVRRLHDQRRAAEREQAIVVEAAAL